MINKIEDNLGKSLMIFVFAILAFIQSGSVAYLFRFPDQIDNWWLVLISRSFSLIFLVMVVLFTLLRLPPKDNADGIEPRISSIVGTFAMMALIVLPTGEVSEGFRVFSTIMIVVGTLLSIYCLRWLGRSFSIMATARKLVTSGPYGIVRHPLYLVEAITSMGIIISNWSVAAVVVGTIHFAFQFRRMFNEERVLRRTFPEYEKYAEQTPFIIPFSKRAA
ncbi:MAG: isoprenylcysteine carboxylmethyltransferase family protein [Hyphomonadaceae bacterium]|nr:isoprenylcysteine carboxylmethyltransferase family protein [Hyphomonadaceae bacterium]